MTKNAILKFIGIAVLFGGLMVVLVRKFEQVEEAQRLDAIAFAENHLGVSFKRVEFDVFFGEPTRERSHEIPTGSEVVVTNAGMAKVASVYGYFHGGAHFYYCVNAESNIVGIFMKPAR